MEIMRYVEDLVADQSEDFPVNLILIPLKIYFHLPSLFPLPPRTLESGTKCKELTARDLLNPITTHLRYSQSPGSEHQRRPAPRLAADFSPGARGAQCRALLHPATTSGRLLLPGPPALHVVPPVPAAVLSRRAPYPQLGAAHGPHRQSCLFRFTIPV